MPKKINSDIFKYGALIVLAIILIAVPFFADKYYRFKSEYKDYEIKVKIYKAYKLDTRNSEKKFEDLSTGSIFTDFIKYGSNPKPVKEAEKLLPEIQE